MRTFGCLHPALNPSIRFAKQQIWTPTDDRGPGPYCVKCNYKRVTSYARTWDGNDGFEILYKCHGEEYAARYEYGANSTEEERAQKRKHINRVDVFTDKWDGVSKNANFVKGTG